MPLKNILVEGFRSFEEYRVDGFRRVNLFVGDNNSGKTSILEAIHILIAQGNVQCTLETLAHRHAIKRVPDKTQDGKVKGHPDVMPLFRSKPKASNSEKTTFSIAEIGEIERRVEATVSYDADSQPFLLSENAYLGQSLYRTQNVKLNGEGLAIGPISPAERPPTVAANQWRTPTHAFIPCHGLQVSRLAELWSKLLPKNNERLAIECVRVTDNKIKNIQFSPTSLSRADIWIDREGQRLSVADLGEGASSLLSIGIALGYSEHGVLFVDEIDTGLHHSKLRQMWKMITTSAQQNDTQVFATTHSLDCIKALAQFVIENPQFADDVAVFRIDRSQEEAVRFAGDELPIVFENEIEVR